jgi:ATPase subunit of ABC transporter with duplicated ATPase domains
MSRATVMITTLFGLSQPRRRPPSSASARAVLARLVSQSQGIALVQGPSGCGKSSLLASISAIARRRGIPLVRAARTPLSATRTVIDLLSTTSDPYLHRAASLLCACGLAEPALWIRSPRTLSDSERARLDLALAVHKAMQIQTRGTKLILVDEFLSTLDRPTARLTCRAIRRLASTFDDIRLILATAHDDLAADLEPTFIIQPREVRS